MPVPAGAIIAAGAQVASTGLSAYSQGKLNRKTRKWNEMMYAKQRADAIADWNSQNAYNHPSAQMARLREAGLNPNLVYGSGATTTADGVRSSSAPTWSPNAPDYGGLGEATGKYFNTVMQEAQTDNLRAQNNVLEQDRLLKMAQIAKTGAETDTSRFGLQQAKELNKYVLEAAALDVQKKDADIKYTLDSNERAEALNASNLREAVERILSSRAQRANTEAERRRIEESINVLRKEGQLKQLDIDLKEKGIQPGDSLFFRVLGRILEQMSTSGPKAWIDKFKFPTMPKN